MARTLGVKILDMIFRHYSPLLVEARIAVLEDNERTRSELARKIDEVIDEHLAHLEVS